jgi:hypothetical protein
MTLHALPRFPKTTPPKPPAGLGRDGRKLWLELQTTYAITDAAGLVLLELAAKSFDDWIAARELLKREGLTVTGGPSGPKVHPAVRLVEVSHRSLMASLRQLHLDVEPLKAVGRPAGSSKRGSD